MVGDNVIAIPASDHVNSDLALLSQWAIIPMGSRSIHLSVNPWFWLEDTGEVSWNFIRDVAEVCKVSWFAS